MPITELNHYSVRTVNVDASAKFYTEVLGFTVGPRPPFPFPGVWLYNGSHDKSSNAVVHVIGVDVGNDKGLVDYMGDRSLDSLKGTGSLDHVAFFANGLTDMTTMLTTKGITFTQREVPSAGLHQVFVTDPSGVVVELNYQAHEYTAAKPA